jgi:outer membrane biosynthesis protein TonB
MAKKHALLIANTEYRDGKLAPLAHPGLAYAELAEALKDPARGAFSQVETLVNANLSNVLGAVDRFFSRKPADAVLLVYVGGHGFVDAQGELFLALKESDRFRLKSTALMAAVLGMNMDQCASPHKLLILDCLYHSPYLDSRGNQAPARIDPAKVFGGRGLPKLILAAGDGQGKAANASGRDSGPKPAGLAAPSTQKIQAVGRDFTRTLAECLRGPSGSLAERTAFTVEDWWNEAAAELKAARCEPPTRHAVGEPPVTVLRGASLSRPEMAFKGTGDTPVPLSRFPMEPESDWSQLSGIFPLEMFAPELASPSIETQGKDVAADEDQTVGGNEADETGGRELPQAPMARMEMRRMAMPRGDETIIADASYLQGADRREEASVREEPARADATLEMEARKADSPADADAAAAAPADSVDPAATVDQPAAAARPDASLLHDLRLPPDLSGEKTLIWDTPDKAEDPGSADGFASMRARLQAQEEAERQARLKQESEEAAQRRKLDRWKARWEQKQEGQAQENPEPTPTATPKPKPTPYQARAAAMQKTLYVPPPDSEAETSAPPARPEPAAGAPQTPAVPDGLATVIVPKDQFLNTGSHKAVTPLTPGATIIISKEEFLGKADLAAAETRMNEAPKEARPARPVRARSEEGRDKGTRSRPPKAPKPPRPTREEGSAGAFRRKAALWALAGLLPVGLGLFAVFGAKSGLFSSLGSGTEASSARKEPLRNPTVTPSARPKPVLPPAAVIDPAEDLAAESAVPAKTEPPATRAPAQSAAPAPAPKPAPAPAPAPAPTPAPKPDPALLARQASLRAQRAYQDSIKAVYYRLRQDSLRAARIARDSLLTARAQAKQDSIQAVRLQLDLERNLRAEIAAAKAAVAKARQDSIRAVKDSIQAEAMLRRSVEAARKAGAEAMRGLYNRFALGYPGLKGEVVVSLQVAPDGEIENGSIWTSTTGLTMFDQVVLGNVMEWKLKPFKGSKAKNIDVAIRFPVE